MKLSPPQYKSISEILGNIAVAWFTAGIVSPLFIDKNELNFLVLYLILGLSMFSLFSIFSVIYAGKS